MHRNLPVSLRLLTLKQVITVLQLPPQSENSYQLYKFIWDEELPTFHVGTQVRIRWKALEQWIQEHEPKLCQERLGV